MNGSADALILHPFNGVFFGFLAIFVLLLILAGVLLRRKSEKTCKAAVVVAGAVGLVCFFLYKYALFTDPEYDGLTAAMGGFNWWGEFPLQLCNINMLLIPIAVLSDSRPLKSFGFFVGPIGALMAILMPVAGFDGYSILLPRMLGYYGIHCLIIIMALSLAVLGLYEPRFRDLPGTVVTLLLVALVIHGVNLLLRYMGLHPHANYFFSVETEGNPLLEIFRGWIPIPYLYLLPACGILAVWAALLTLIYDLCSRKGRTKRPGKARRKKKGARA